MNLLAQNPIDLGGSISGPGLGPFGKTPPASGTDALIKITRAVSSIIGLLTIGASLWFLFQLVFGGLAWITAGGDKTKLNEARDRLTNAFIGLLIVVAGWSILALIGQFLGFDILITNPGQLMNIIQLK